ncbi:hypothetical protein N0V90_004171 [Kalmusia sp. IMI 367209]|nr:hypothetical protein N0V90_004171 [Kalmusia sp. IMI 367209]
MPPKDLTITSMSTPLSKQMGLPEYVPAQVLHHFGPEIRNIIYNEVLCEDPSGRTSKALMWASKDLRDEAGTHFYANEVHVAKLPHPAIPGATVLPLIHDRYLHLLTVQYIARVMRNLTTIGADFEHVQFLIQGSPKLSCFLNEKFDDSIMNEGHPITQALRHILESGVSRVVMITALGAHFAPGVATQLKADFGSLEEEIDAGDDVNIDEDLVPLEEEEAEAIANKWLDSNWFLKDQAQAITDIEFLISMAPKLL